MKKRLIFPLFLTIISIIGGVVLWWLFFSVGSQRIIEKFSIVYNDPVTIVEIPIAEATYVHVGVDLGSIKEKVELWDPNGNLVSTQFPQDKRSPLDRLHDYWAGSGLIYRVDFLLWQPMEGDWKIRIFKVPEDVLFFSAYVDATSTVTLDVELGQAQEVAEGHLVPVVARLYRGNELICDENLQIEVEVKVPNGNSPKIHALQSDDNCVFTGSTGVIELGDLGFYVIAKDGFVRRQLFFDKPD